METYLEKYPCVTEGLGFRAWGFTRVSGLGFRVYKGFRPNPGPRPSGHSPGRTAAAATRAGGRKAPRGLRKGYLYMSYFKQ